MTQNEINSWDARTRHLTKAELIRTASFSEFRIYEDQLPEGAVLDIGPGLGYEALYFADKKRKVVAVDKETYFLDRIRAHNGAIVTVESEMPYGALPEGPYALAILSNLLHFMDRNASRILCDRVASLLPAGAYVLVRVHSTDHPYARPDHPKHSKFSHFFSEPDMVDLFNSSRFKPIWLSHCKRSLSKREVQLFGLKPQETHRKASFTLIVQRI